jgi:hypothetical protein
MNALAPAEVVNAEVKLLQPGAPFAGGFFVGIMNVNGQLCALIASPKAGGELRGAWNASAKSVAGALSYCDGRTNTAAMAEAGSNLAKQILALEIGGFADWYLPAQDELEMLYRHFKPTAEQNYLYARSGVNASASPATHAYTADSPAQTCVESFKDGEANAFDAAWYWSSTQHAGDPDCAWLQFFGDGGQFCDHKSNQYRARAVRRLVIQ